MIKKITTCAIAVGALMACGGAVAFEQYGDWGADTYYGGPPGKCTHTTGKTDHLGEVYMKRECVYPINPSNGICWIDGESIYQKNTKSGSSGPDGPLPTNAAEPFLTQFTSPDFLGGSNVAENVIARGFEKKIYANTVLGDGIVYKARCKVGYGR